MARVQWAAPQFLVDDLERTLAFYEDQLGFTRDFVYEGFYASIALGAARIHLKCAEKLPAERSFRKDGEHVDAYLETEGVRELHAEFEKRGVVIDRPPEVRPWGNVDFYVEDPDGYILCFSEPA